MPQQTLIVLGPGIPVYREAVIPNLLVSGVAEAIEKSSATCVYIANVMTQPGETRNYALGDHVRAIQRHARKKFLDWVVVNSAPYRARNGAALSRPGRSNP